MAGPGQRVKLIITAGAAAAIVLGTGLWLAIKPKAEESALFGNGNFDVVRADYGALYQAAWRQDEGRGDILITATLFVPPLIDLLGRDAGRSEADNQIWRQVQAVDEKQIALFVTIDSVAGPVSDQTVRENFSLSAGQTKFELKRWQPLILPSRVVNAAEPTSSQSGVLVFSSASTIDWTALVDLRLTVKNLGGQEQRQLVWAEPGLLLAVE